MLVATTSPSSVATKDLVHLYIVLRAWATRLCGRADGEDIVSETLTRMLERGEFATHSGDQMMLRRVAFAYSRRIAFELFRQRSRSGTSGEESEGSTSRDLADEIGLRVGFSKLAREDQELLIAVDVDGVEQLGLARGQDVPPGTVRARTTRARRRLRSLVENGCPVPPVVEGGVR